MATFVKWIQYSHLRVVLTGVQQNFVRTFSVSRQLMTVDLRRNKDGNTDSETNTLKSFKELPGPKGPTLWPFIGAAFLFKPFAKQDLKRSDLMARDLHRIYGKRVLLRLQNSYTVCLSDPKDILYFIRNDEKAPLRPNFDMMEFYYESTKTKTLSTIQGEEWRHLRMRVQPKFLRPSAPDPYIPAIGKVADDFVTVAEKLGPKSDLKELTFAYALESIGQFCFSKRYGVLTAAGVDTDIELIRRSKQIFLVLAENAPVPLYRLWKTKKYKEFKENMDFLLGFSRREVASVVKSLETSGDVGQDNSPHFIATIMADSDLTQDELITTMSEFFFGGTDTTSRMLTLLLFHLGKYPEKERLLAEEIKKVTSGAAEITKEQLDKLSYTKAFVKESMRMVFPLPFGPTRILGKDTQLDEYLLPKGTMVFFSNNAILHNPEEINNPEEFRPERWLRGKDGRKEEEIPTHSFLPFGFGVRQCIGKRFAELMLHLALIKMVQRYEVRLPSDMAESGIKYEVFATIDGPLNLQLTPR